MAKQPLDKRHPAIRETLRARMASLLGDRRRSRHGFAKNPGDRGPSE
jgi:hypothetical protein